MLIFQTAGGDGETYIDPAAIIAIEDRGGDAGTLVYLSGGQSISVDALPSKIVAQMQDAEISVRVPTRVE